ncbi:hypothetical protein J3Q64DRAFT_1700361 [Phycomyces blakesleeanus]|uniref:Uncharacterized protein n=2 Tax=Phycomyces blakesleeanus TaxID=4837 RepID=A0A167PQZ9_PHYB8|nr:hypothetical protein PHYBLDRAFT_69678 [Phycomyces blakesleeanus NRRL 1555(-)]OAD78376.1 hypothetical protein PHYBLDRAFT_69678 [Phycomyces blakesleeanus NRRL 1555(-)]|eukprot:XP_018296416.1 hypothetical protein PHYBLDRAFT_69678 [Phycomyces blakesleeanus NRRL 1555(-)]
MLRSHLALWVILSLKRKVTLLAVVSFGCLVIPTLRLPGIKQITCASIKLALIVWLTGPNYLKRTVSVVIALDRKKGLCSDICILRLKTTPKPSGMVYQLYYVHSTSARLLVLFKYQTRTR